MTADCVLGSLAWIAQNKGREPGGSLQPLPGLRQGALQKAAWPRERLSLPGTAAASQGSKEPPPELREGGFTDAPKIRRPARGMRCGTAVGRGRVESTR